MSRGFLSAAHALRRPSAKLRRMESLGEWRASGVLLHLPLAKRAIPEKLVLQSELVCRRLASVCSCLVSLSLWERAGVRFNPSPARLIIGYSSIPVDWNLAAASNNSLIISPAFPSPQP